jgi:L-seryl-tRNA(Ser) seleniumtransferase
MPKSDTTNALLRALPSVDSVLKTDVAREINEKVGAARLSSLARQVTNQLRHELLSKTDESSAAGAVENGLRAELLKEAERRLSELYCDQNARGLRRIINATGVILHTNLGRAPLSAAARRAVEMAAGYCSLEYDVVAGMRGRRGGKVEDLVVELTGAEGALVVNNCAAAALLVLSTLARDGETIVSRGELVEIGGDFRVPEVMAQSGTRMVEVGTTNRTQLADYRKAVSENTRLLMRVHTSNYRIVGFTKTPTLSQLAELAHDAGLPLYEDAGSGALVDLAEYAIEGEPVIRESLQAGADVVTFSGDKLLGGPQAGIIVGRAQLIERMRANPLYRALRADKLRLAALEATLEEYSREEKVPAQQMIAMTAAEIGARVDCLIAGMSERIPSSIRLEKVEGESAVGGGSAPTSPLPTFLLSVTSSSLTANEIETVLRRREPAILVRIVADRVVIDLRTVAEGEDVEIERALAAFS